MATNHTLDLHVSPDLKMEEVWFSFGVLPSPARERPMAQGYGFSIELPAVLDLLRGLDRGELDAATVRASLVEALGELYEQAGCYDYERPENKLAWCKRDGGCPHCDRFRNRFAEHLTEMAERWRAFGLPEEFPFAVGRSKGLHTVGCPVVRRYMPDGFPTYGPDDVEALRAFAHAHNAYGQCHYDLQDLPAGVVFSPLSAEEARAWMVEHTGPKGGRQYKRCQRCAPTP